MILMVIDIMWKNVFSLTIPNSAVAALALICQFLAIKDFMTNMVHYVRYKYWSPKLISYGLVLDTEKVFYTGILLKSFTIYERKEWMLSLQGNYCPSTILGSLRLWCLNHCCPSLDEGYEYSKEIFLI